MLDQQTELDILALERRRQQALVAVDLEALDALFDDDLVHVHSTGLVHGKAELITHIGRKRGFVDVQRGPLQIRGDADMAVMTGPIVNHIRTAEGAEEVMRGFVTQVLRHTAAGWKFISFQLTVAHAS
ncbi:nuclear transport factor 2 family protein [Pseudomonas sp. WS 5106]|uniref:Nuclear transport factor 2 family protein n=1 Tax=Pseudomonas cremoris TaxID=2724178 RepID=A0A7X1ARH5_9PSED|nr:nuclear transport factor 2 family protein [Pseudomonas cremoris]MBC2384648.1 nuclear transport factor 2 family protein [Pseudomonas cremoris]MBC2409032.1 nuclear transport factor 2 family protein [Pseudomonas cremoris]